MSFSVKPRYFYAKNTKAVDQFSPVLENVA